MVLLVGLASPPLPPRQARPTSSCLTVRKPCTRCSVPWGCGPRAGRAGASPRFPGAQGRTHGQEFCECLSVWKSSHTFQNSLLPFHTGSTVTEHTCFSGRVNHWSLLSWDGPLHAHSSPSLSLSPPFSLWQREATSFSLIQSFSYRGIIH